MALTDSERKLIEQNDALQALLEPFKRVVQDWTVETTHRFRTRLRDVHLVASGDLVDGWHVNVIAGDTGVIVADFSFPEYGRYFDMRRVEFTTPPPAGRDSDLYDWVRRKAAAGAFKYSTLAERRGLTMTDPRVIHDLTYRIARSDQFRLPRRRWYNKGKEASIGELYSQLQDVMAAHVMAAARHDLADRPN